MGGRCWLAFLVLISLLSVARPASGAPYDVTTTTDATLLANTILGAGRDVVGRTDPDANPRRDHPGWDLH